MYTVHTKGKKMAKQINKYSQAELAKKQVELEYMMRSVGIARFHDNDNRNVDFSASQTSYNSRIISGCVEQLAERIDAFKEHYEGRRGSRPSYLNLLAQVDTKTVALISLRTVIDLMSAKDMHISNMMHRVGSRIEDQVKFAGLEQHAPKYVEKILEQLAKKGTKQYKHKQRTLDKACDNSSYKHTAWVKDTVTQLGGFLIHQVASLTFNGQPLMTKQVIDTGIQSTHSEVKLVMSDFVCDWIGQFQEANEVLTPAYAPCVVPPKPWTTPFVGGYHVKEIAETMSLVRGKRKHVEGLTYKQMPVVYDAINALQNVGWKISPVVEVLQNVMELGLPLGIPQQNPLRDNLRASPVPSSLSHLSGKALMDMLTSEEQKQFMQWKADAAEIDTKDNIRKAELVQLQRILNEAKRYEQFDAFWFVYTLDYRSRVYCSSSLITTQGNDVQKGLIRFAEGKKLGYYGAYWLAIQGAGVWAAKDENGIALDKKPAKERVKTVYSLPFIEMVKNIVADPLCCTEWCNADKPWQFLNWCYEFADFLAWCEAGNSHKDFVSYLPIAQDGSCSGTQHYAMMLRDTVSAEMTNLLPCDKPNDIYGSAADLFKDALLKCINDPEAEIGAKALASEWLNHANRNLCKPPVMTLVYGSAQMTCRKTTIEYLLDTQSKEDKKAIADGHEPKKMWNFESVTEAASFASPLIWDSVGHVQSAAKNGMKTIKQVASFCVKHNQPMQWTTPTGFIVTQDIKQTKQNRVNTMMFGGTKVTLRTETDTLDGNKMRSSSAPNFIHSMDASHLILTCYNVLVKAGLKSMAVIHDSFGVHACDTNKLRRILLRTIVKMYSENDVLGDLVAHNEYIADDVADNVEMPVLGNLDFNEVLKAKYAFF